MHLNDRQQQVLWATIRHYIATAEPVGSKALVEEYNLSASPATIRNAMGALEKAGFLYQPHTSAGRVPSDSGYRLYVDQLITPAPAIGQQVEQLLADKLNREDWSLEALLRGAAQILASLSGYITLITLPQTNRVRLRHLRLMQIEPGQVMLVVVTDIYETQSVLMELRDQTQGSPAFNPDRIEGELEILSNFLNAHLQGRALADLPALNWSELGQEFQRYADFLRTSLAELARRSQASSAAYTHILVRGVSEVLRQPEFAELQQVQTVLHVLEEEQDQLWSLFLEVPDPLPAETRNRVQVWIGSENPLEPMRNCALVAASYRRGSMPVGRVGMLGPTRMMYENAIAVVEAAADYLSDTLR